MEELLSKIKYAIPFNGVTAVSKSGVGVMVKSEGKIYFCAEGEDEWKEVIQ